MTTLVFCPGCQTPYDLSRREAGKRVRCRSCKSVLVVPSPRQAAEASVTASSRLRKAQGPSCSWHPKTVARARCRSCRSQMCRLCRTAAPGGHLCRECAHEYGVEGALPLDYGFFRTYGLALRAFLPSFSRIFVWSLISLVMAFTLCAIPALLGYSLWEGGGSSWRGSLGLGLLLGALLVFWLLNEYLLIPAGCTLFVNSALRKKPTTGFRNSIGKAWARVADTAGRLVQIFLAYFLLAVLLCFPALVAYVGLSGIVDNPGIALGVSGLLLGLGALFLATRLGLAVPVTLLEERSAFESLGRAWELSGQRPWMLATQFAVFALIAGLASVPGYVLDSPLTTLVLSRLVDLFWPALLVAAYHGLAAEHAKVLGRS